MAFTGEYHHTMDSKNRIAVPAKFRGELGETVWITRDFDHNLAIYSDSQWQAKLKEYEALDRNDENIRKFIFYFINKAESQNFDAQGRIHLSDALIRYGHLIKEGDPNRNCVFAGSLDHITLWSEEAYEKYDESVDDDFVIEMGNKLACSTKA